MLLSGMGEAIALNLLAVEKFIEKVGYKKQLELLTKVMGLSDAIIGYQREHNKKEAVK
jgi:hypothetical protein